ncbi:amidohydrolase [Desulfosarcina sp. OttesenSCG-928-B08]|nr:amidohydrolase [Desulfosarcina sp. OttesenSCG-928-B08]
MSSLIPPDADIAAYIKDVRQQLHRIPELAMAEKKTSALIEAELRKLGFSPRCNIAGTGIIADLVFPAPGPTVMIRADMDALPIQEETGLDCVSLHDGTMHACGHDGHMAMVLGAAKHLVQCSRTAAGKNLCGTVRFVFQPAEESACGAQAMMDAGVLEGVDCCLATHIWPEIPKGTIGVREGYLMAAMGKFTLTLTGKGGHGSQPHLCTDVVDAAAQVTCALQHVVSRRINPVLPAVLTVGSLQAGHTYNIIPQTARIMGTTRAFHQEVRESWENHIRQVVEGVCAGAGVLAAVDFSEEDGPVDNDPAVTSVVREAAIDVVGKSRVVDPGLSMTSEDFARYQTKVPGCLFFLGAGTASGKPLHNSGFTFNEEILITGTAVFCSAVARLLGQS